MVVGPVRMSRDVVSSLWIKRVPWANIFFAMVTAAAMAPALLAFGLVKLELVDADIARPVSIALAVALVAVCGAVVAAVKLRGRPADLVGAQLPLANADFKLVARPGWEDTDGMCYEYPIERVSAHGGTAGTWRVLAFSNSFSEILWRWAVLEAERDGTVWIDVLVGGLRRGDKDKG